MCVAFHHFRTDYCHGGARNESGKVSGTLGCIMVWRHIFAKKSAMSFNDLGKGSVTGYDSRRYEIAAVVRDLDAAVVSFEATCATVRGLLQESKTSSSALFEARDSIHLKTRYIREGITAIAVLKARTRKQDHERFDSETRPVLEKVCLLLLAKKTDDLQTRRLKQPRPHRNYSMRSAST